MVLMVDNLKDMVVERLYDLGFTEIDERFYNIVTVYLNGNIEFMCLISFFGDHVMVETSMSTCRVFSYDEFTDVDVFIGSILCMRFYDV